MAGSRTTDRMNVIEHPQENVAEAFARDVMSGLARDPKRLSCRFLYDDEGSRLFDEICDTPEYYPTRTEIAMLEAHAAEIAGLFPEEMALAELGGGSARKTRVIIEALLEGRESLDFTTIDISKHALEESARALLADYPGLEMTAVAGEYRDGLVRIVGDIVGRSAGRAVCYGLCNADRHGARRR